MFVSDELHTQILTKTWDFIRARFAFQAKILKRRKNLTLAQAYDLLAKIHGYSSWRGCSKVLDALALLDTKQYALMSPRCLKDSQAVASLCLALQGVPGEFQETTDAEFSGVEVEKRIRKAPKIVLRGPNDLDAIFEAAWAGFTDWETVREVVLYQSMWLGVEHPISASMFSILDASMERLEALGVPWSESVGDVAALYGIEGNDVQDVFEALSDDSVTRVNEAIAHSFEAQRSIGLSYDELSAFMAAGQGKTLPIASWRPWLRQANPRALDGRIESGHVTCLVLGNAPDSCFAHLELSPGVRIEREGRAIPWFGFWSLFAPDEDAAAKAAATSSGFPQVRHVTDEHAQSLGMPELKGYLEIPFD